MFSKKCNKKFELKRDCNRNFSKAFKKAKVKELLNKQIGVSEFSRLYGVSRSAVYKWIYLYGQVEKGTKTIVQMESEAYKTKQLQLRVAELERLYGQKQLEVDYLLKAFEFASADLGFDVKKKYESMCSDGFKGSSPKMPTP